MTLNRYAKLKRHKRYLKQRHAKALDRWDVHYDEEKAHREHDETFETGCQWKWHDPRNRGYTYWHNYYLSGGRKYAKSCTNRRIRAKYRQLASKNMKDEYLEDVIAPQGSDYEKEFDYSWTIW